MAVHGERILAVGSDAEMMRLAGPQTKKWDLKGHTVTPGLINTHTHLHDAAVNTWAQHVPEKVEAIRKTVTVTGKTGCEITEGIELVVKEQMAHPLPSEIGSPAGRLQRLPSGKPAITGSITAPPARAARMSDAVASPRPPGVLMSPRNARTCATAKFL